MLALRFKLLTTHSICSLGDGLSGAGVLPPPSPCLPRTASRPPADLAPPPARRVPQPPP